ncbi:hypothetical protein D1BOALGB6SA_1132 [Olavius sp. associated proteobacterium Delta 1]|nr:hypothetical protein D1BOALGB6SA_1132 [Olavius sp. associated proteobacterium Delta 1]
MNFKNLMVISTVLALGFGVGFLLLPGPLASLYGFTLNPSGVFIARLLGVELAGYGLLAWFIRNIVDTQIQRPILLAFFITDGIGFIVKTMHVRYSSGPLLTGG